MEIGLRLFGALARILSFFLWPYYYLLSFRNVKRLPPIRSPLLKLSACALARKIRTGEVTSEEVVGDFVQRCRDVNPIINAFVEERFEEAILEARRVDALIRSGSKNIEELEKDTPLLGVPITVKESCSLKGMSQCVGCRPRLGVTASKDGEAVARMLTAGAIAIGVTNTPELCLCWETGNLVTGTTLNPYNTYRTPGGSSGGEGAILGSGGSVIGIGSDFAGSIRVPAMFCGVFGHKPTPGYIPIEGHYPYVSDEIFRKFLVVGPMARYAEDLLLSLKVMSGEKGKDLHLDDKVELSTLKVYYKLHSGFSLVSIPVESDIQIALLDAATYMSQQYKCSIVKAELNEFEESVEISASNMFGIKGIPNLLDLCPKKTKEESSNLFTELLKAILGFSEFSLFGLIFMLIVKYNGLISKKNFSEYERKNEALKTKLNKLLGDDGVLLYPTFPIPAFHHNEFLVRAAGIMYGMIFNSLELPSTHVPLGLNSEGLPIGIQVVGGFKHDRLCIAVAKALEEKFNGWIPPSPEIIS